MPFAEPTNLTRLYKYFQYGNEVTAGAFGNWMLLATFAILYISMKLYTDARAFAYSSFITMIIAVFMRGIDMIGDFALMLAIGAAILGMVMAYFSSVEGK